MSMEGFDDIDVLKSKIKSGQHPAVVHKKTNHVYTVVGFAINATNKDAGREMIIYERNEELFVREIGEFVEKFSFTRPSKVAENVSEQQEKK